MDYLGLIPKGGVIMWSVLLCAIIVAGVIVERLVALWKAQRSAGQFMANVKSLVGHGDLAGILTFCSQKNEPIANIIRHGVLRYGEGEESMRAALRDAEEAEVYKLGKWLPLLMSMIGIAPMLGLLGTVTSLIRALHTYELRGGAGSPLLLVAAGWESLVTAALGLCVGILALAWYHYLTSRVRKCARDFADHGVELLELVKSRKAESAAPEVEFRPKSGAPAARTLAYDEDQFFRRKS